MVLDCTLGTLTTQICKVCFFSCTFPIRKGPTLHLIIIIWCDMSCLHCFLSFAISSVMFNFLMSSPTSFFQVLFSLPTGILPSTSSSIALLSLLSSAQRFTWQNRLNLVFLNLSSKFSTPHLFVTS